MGLDARYGSFAVSQPRKLSDRLWSWSGQLNGKPPTPGITGRIRLMLLKNSLSAEIGTQVERIDPGAE